MNENNNGEILFNNTFIMEKQYMRIYLDNLYFKSKKAIIRYIFMVLYLLVCVLIYCKLYNNILFICLPAMVLLFELYRWIMYFQARKANDNRFDEISNCGERRISLAASDSCIHVESYSGMNVDVTYDKFVDVRQVQNLICLRSKGNVMYIFEINSFTKGDPVEFMCFLRSKDIKVK